LTAGGKRGFSTTGSGTFAFDTRFRFAAETDFADGDFFRGIGFFRISSGLSDVSQTIAKDYFAKYIRKPEKFQLYPIGIPNMPNAYRGIIRIRIAVT
jgi:hypothetical protein